MMKFYRLGLRWGFFFCFVLFFWAEFGECVCDADTFARGNLTSSSLILAREFLFDSSW
jgi:hypothetical protein